MNRNHTFLNSSTVAVVLAFIAISPCAHGQETKKEKPQQPEDVIRVYTDLVQTDVMVFDKHGRFVNGLKRDAFSLRIDGKPQPIEFFDSVVTGSATEKQQLASPGGTSSGNSAARAPDDRSRTILFYIDDFHLSAGDMILLKRALLKFIDDDLAQNDQAVITSASGQIGFLQQLTDNKAVLRAAVMRIHARPPSFVSDGEQPPMNEHQALVIDRSPAAMGSPSADPLVEYFIQRAMEDGAQGPVAIGRGPNGSSPRDVAELRVRARARSILEQAASFTTNSLASFESLVDSSAQLPGRKLVFFISDGFYTDRRNSDAAQKIDHITHKATRSGVIVYSMDARALTTAQPQAGEPIDVTEMTGIVEREQKNELSESREGMTILAAETGGRAIFDTNALETGLANAVKETSEYYLLGWRASHEIQTARKAPHIEVSLRDRPDLSVRLGHGFATVTTPASSKSTVTKSEKPSESKLRDAIIGIYPLKEIPLALDLQYQKSDKGVMLTASMQIFLESLFFSTESEKMKTTADVAGFIYNDQGKVVQHFNKRMSLAPVSLDSMTDEIFTFKYQAVLTPGLYQVRVGIRDEASGKNGTVHQWVEIPDLNSRELTLSSLIAGELPTPTQGAKGQTSQMILRANHRFRRDRGFRFVIYAYNAGLARTNSKPDLVVQAQVLRERQAVLTTTFLQVPTSDISSGERIPITADLSLTDLPAGRYLLRVTVIDHVAKISASREMHLEIE